MKRGSRRKKMDNGADGLQYMASEPLYIDGMVQIME